MNAIKRAAELEHPYDGADPLALALAGTGHLYGTTNGGFFNPVGGGTTFEIILP